MRPKSLASFTVAPAIRMEQATAVKDLDYSQMRTLVRAFANEYKLEGLSHRVLAVHPCGPLGRIDRWAINFKSIQIAKDVVELMQLREDNLREMYDTLHNIPESSVMAG